MNPSERLERQIEFIAECDRLKSVLRQTTLIHDTRRENSAEHSWTLALMAMTLAEHANEPIDVSRTVRMLILHDVVEVYAGDVFVYDVARRANQAEVERAAADKLFGSLPEPTATEFRALWDEFEAKATPEARFAGAMDRLAPLIVNSRAESTSWKKHGILESQALERNAPIARGSTRLWEYAKGLIAKGVERGLLKR